MVKNFTHKGLEDFFYRGTKKGIQPKHAEKLGLILDRLEAAHELRDMNYPGSGFHPLAGDYRGYYSVKVSENWRVIFKFERGDAYSVGYIDYH